MDSSSDEEWETNEIKAQKLYKSAKDIARKSKESKEELKKCYEFLVKANKLFPCEKYQTRVNQVKEQLEERDDESDSDDEVFNFGTVEKKAVEKVPKNEKLDKNKTEVAPGLIISNDIFDKLYPYQKEGVRTLYKWFAEKKGGILADDMGLGKTIQTIVLLSALFDYDMIKHVLIIAPISLLQNWHDEFAKWAPNLQIYTYHGNNKLIQLQFVQRRGGVLLTTYDTARINFQYLNSKGASTFVWDYVILDEAHKIKNPTKTTRSLHEIPARVRLCITGTPVQNNLRELWVLYDFSMNGTLLGTYPTFKANYETPITKVFQ